MPSTLATSVSVVPRSARDLHLASSRRSANSGEPKKRKWRAQATTIAPAAFDRIVRRRELYRRSEDRAHLLEGLRKAG